MAHSAARTIIAPRLKLFPYLTLRLVVPFIAYVPLSLSYALVSVAFGLPYGGKYVLPTRFELPERLPHQSDIPTVKGSCSPLCSSTWECWR